VEVDDEECFVGQDFFAAVVFFAFDASVAACEFGTECFGDAEYFSVWGIGCVGGVSGDCLVFWDWGSWIDESGEEGEE